MRNLKLHWITWANVRKLAAPVGVADAIDYGMISKFERNMENKDSLTAVINEVMQKSGRKT